MPCALAYTLYHLHRMLTDNGQYVFVVPFLGGNYDEYFGDIDEAERARRFGKNDHVRRLSRRDIHSHIGAIIELPGTFDAEAKFGAEILHQANLRHGHSSSSV